MRDPRPCAMSRERRSLITIINSSSARRRLIGRPRLTPSALRHQILVRGMVVLVECVESVDVRLSRRSLDIPTWFHGAFRVEQWHQDPSLCHHLGNLPTALPEFGSLKADLTHLTWNFESRHSIIHRQFRLNLSSIFNKCLSSLPPTNPRLLTYVLNLECYDACVHSAQLLIAKRADRTKQPSLDKAYSVWPSHTTFPIHWNNLNLNKIFMAYIRWLIWSESPYASPDSFLHFPCHMIFPKVKS